MGDTGVKFVGLAKWERDLKRQPAQLRRQLKRRLKHAALHLRGKVRAEFGGRITNRRTRRRPRGGTTLGVVTGEAKRSVKVRKVEVRGRKDFRAVIGPRPGAAVAGFYLRFHEDGLAGMPRRQTVTPGTRKAAAGVFDLIGRAVKVLR